MNPKHVKKVNISPDNTVFNRKLYTFGPSNGKVYIRFKFHDKGKHALINCAFRVQDHVGWKLLKIDGLSRYTWRTSRQSLVCRALDTATRMRWITMMWQLRVLVKNIKWFHFRNWKVPKRDLKAELLCLTAPSRIKNRFGILLGKYRSGILELIVKGVNLYAT